MEAKVLILSDTHGIVDQRILGLAQECDHVIHAGDICGAVVLQSLKVKGQLIAVRGNNDHPSIWTKEERQVVESIPDVAQLSLPGGVIKVEHGHRHGFQHPDHTLLRQAHPEAKLIVYGHTHKQVLDKEDSPWIVNPGAAGHTRTRGGPSCVLLQASELSWEIHLRRFSD